MQALIQRDSMNKLRMDEATEDPATGTTARMCNCRTGNTCPLNGQCLTPNVIYQAEVKCDGQAETYVGLTANSFKARFNNHKSSFNNENKRLSTELSKYVWSLKDQGKDYSISWKILCQANPYNNLNKKCHLCITEKFYIICRPSGASLNKRSELISKCRHMDRFLIGNVT